MTQTYYLSTYIAKLKVAKPGLDRDLQDLGNFPAKICEVVREMLFRGLSDKKSLLFSQDFPLPQSN